MSFLLYARGVVGAEEKWTGSEFQTQEALGKADAIFLGTLKEMGFQGPKSVVPEYVDVKVHVMNTYYGKVGQDVLVHLFVLTHRDERSPSVGGRYIFFVAITKSPQLEVLKLLPADAVSIADVRRLIEERAK